MTPQEQLEQWLETTVEKVQRNIEIVIPTELEQNYLLHISTNTRIRKFIPVIGRRQGVLEDRTVPRIATAPTLLGCLIGYAKAEWDFMNLKPTGTQEDYGYKGGFKIYEFAFEAALRPGTRLVYDAKMSDEHWLTTFNKDTVEYIPKVAGTCFYRTVTYVSRTSKAPNAEGILYVEVLKEEGLQFSQHHLLTKGYWRIEGPMPQNTRAWNSDKAFNVASIGKPEYLEVKNASVALLGFNERPPSYLAW